MKNLILIYALTIHVHANAQIEIINSIKPGWHKIGETTINFKIDNESILVIGSDKFKAIKLKSIDADLSLISLDIYYASEKVEQIPLKTHLKAGKETAEILLKEGYQQIKKVIFTYKTVPDSKDNKALVELFGLN